MTMMTIDMLYNHKIISVEFSVKVFYTDSRLIFQEKYFQLLEFVVFQLKFVPCKELISLSILLKAQHSISCSIICINTLLTILKWV